MSIRENDCACALFWVFSWESDVLFGISDWLRRLIVSQYIQNNTCVYGLEGN